MTAATVGLDLDAALNQILSGAGIRSPHTPLTPAAGGDDNRVYTTSTAAGVTLIVKVARRTGDRFAVAEWASRQCAVFGVPVPRVIGYTDLVSVETRCHGDPLATDAPSAVADRLTLTQQAGRVLRRLHAVPVAGAGRLDGTGNGRYRTWRQWLLAPTGDADPAAADLLTRVYQALARHTADLPEPSLRLLHGDWVARHVIVDAGDVSGVVDLQSVRGGDPLADLAGWSLQEPASLTEALFAGYGQRFDDTARLALTLYRLRIGAALHRYHLTRAGVAAAGLRARQLACDLEDLATGTLRLIPRITVRDPRRGLA